MISVRMVQPFAVSWLRGLELPPSMEPINIVNKKYLNVKTKHFGSLLLEWKKDEDGLDLIGVVNTDDHETDYILEKEWGCI